MDGVDVTGDAAATLVTIPDDEWGYAGGRLTALRVQGRGEIRITLKADVVTERIAQLVVRARRVSGRPATITADWAGPGTVNGDETGSLVRDRIGSKQWEILTLDLADAASWQRQSRVDRISLRIVFDGGGPDTVDLDFAILAP